MSTRYNFAAISVGNSRTAIGLFEGTKLQTVEHVANEQPEAVVDVVQRWAEQLGDKGPPADESSRAVLLATVNEPVAEELAKHFGREPSIEVAWIERDLPIPIGRRLDRESLVGQDRLLNAAAAYDGLKQACVVVDAGTAITVDFVDGEGTFHGGAIAPGAQLQLDALHQRADLLPELRFATPNPEPFAPNTSQAMLHGVYYGIQGMVRHLIERYAEAYEAYPHIVATGGDAHILFDDDELIEHIVDDLTLLGIGVAARVALELESEAP